MKKLLTCMLWCICTCSILKAQLNDDFIDGNMSDDPIWVGDISKFEVDGSQKLHLNAPAVSSQAYLSTASHAIGESEWSWFTQINTNPSANNFCKVYLVSDQGSLDGALNGYFIKIGGTNDEVSLFRQDGLTETLIINGGDDRVDTSLVQINIKVSRDLAGNWSLQSKPVGEPNFIAEGTAFDDTHTNASFFGVYCQYTSTRSTAFYFDDFLVTGTPIPDNTAPGILNHQVSSSHEIKLNFSEPLSTPSVFNKANYSLNGQQASGVVYADDTVKLTFASPFPNALTQQLIIKNMADQHSNVMPDTTVEIFYFEKIKAIWGNLVINEIFPDPSPSIQNLPEDSDAEFIEIYNPSLNPFDLQNWLINGKLLPPYILMPGQYVILCKPAFEATFQSYGKVLSLNSWPSLSNSGASIVLSDDEMNVIDSVSYTSSQIIGGFSLERVHVEHPCGGQSNLAFSRDVNGASPGKINSVFSDEADLQSPDLLKVTTISKDSLVLTFSEKTYFSTPLEQQIKTGENNYPQKAAYLNPDSSEVLVVFANPLASNTHHLLNVLNACDCSGNINSQLDFPFYLDLTPPSLDQVIVSDTADVRLIFLEKLLKANAENESNYIIYPSGEKPKKAILSEDSLSVFLTFQSTLDIQDSVSLSVQQLADLYNNLIPTEQPLSFSFIYHSPIDSIKIINAYQLDIKIKLVPNMLSAINVNNYTIDSSIGNPAKVIADPEEPHVLHLLLPKPLSANKLHVLSISNLLDDNNELISTPIYRFFYDTKGPAIKSVQANNEQEMIIYFDEKIQTDAGQKIKLWVDKDTVALESYNLFADYLSLKLKTSLPQERSYTVAVEGILDIQSNPSDPAQSFKFLLDQLAPHLDTAFVYSPYELMLVFHEPILEDSFAAEHYLRFIQPTYIPSQIKFYQLSPERVLFTFAEKLGVGSMHFQISNLSDRQKNKISSPIDVEINAQHPTIGHIIPLSNKHIQLNFSTGIQDVKLNTVDFLLNNALAPDSLSLTSAHQLELWFSQPFHEFTDYWLSFSQSNSSQDIRFQYQDFVESVEHDGSSTVKIQFNEPLEKSTAENIKNYILDENDHPLAAIYLPDIQSVQLLFNEQIDRKKLHTLHIKDLSNIDDFPLPQSSQLFGMGKIPAYHELLLTEIMSKPAPSIGLPEAEYVEVVNASEQTLQLKGLRLSDTQKSVALTDTWLAPGEYLILCSTANVERLSALGPCMGISGFPNLNDDTDTLRLVSSSGQEVHSVAYSESWYNDAIKSKGGWSLEMIDTGWPCQGMSNWRASEDEKGGTPGKVNSVQQSNPDLNAPDLLSAVAEDSLHISLIFDEKLGRHAAEEVEISLKDIEIEHILLQKEACQLYVQLHSPLKTGIVYKLSVSQVADCSGNYQADAKEIKIRLPDHHLRNDVLVSELLFHPRTGGVDFVELYNHSDKYLNLKQWKLATKVGNDIHESGIISNETLILAPGEYLAITENKNTLIADYPSAAEGRVLESKAFPSLSADGGVLLLMDADGQIMQEIHFSPDWHHPLLQEPRGVSLERISWNNEENAPQYWQSAASSAGYATPGFQNSQWQNLQEANRKLQVDPPIFYPDQTSYQDYTHIQYQFAGAGNIGNLKVFDARGKMIRQLAQNQSLAEEGFFVWDGTDDFKKRVNIGYYIVWMEVFKPDGSVHILKSKVVVGSRF